jgi:hypothetical protein
LFRYLASALLSVSTIGLFSAALSPSPADILGWWNAATAASAAASGYVASRTVIRIEELDESGLVTSFEEAVTKLDWTKPVTETVVVSAVKNGKDVTEDWRKRYAKMAKDQAKAKADGTSGASGSGGPPGGFDATPFDPKYARSVARSEPRAAATGIEVPYVITTEGGPVEGVASFTGSGAALGAVQRWSKPPVFVSAMNSRLRYAYQDAALVVASMQIEGEASVLFIKRRFRMGFEFSDWRKSASQQ